MSLSSEDRDKIVGQFNSIKKIEDIHDGFNTFRELYDSRNVLFCSILKNNPSISWKSKKDFEDSDLGDWFIAGIDLPTGTVTFHMEMVLWDLLSNITELNNAPKWDNSNSEETLKRLLNWII